MSIQSLQHGTGVYWSDSNLDLSSSNGVTHTLDSALRDYKLPRAVLIIMWTQVIKLRFHASARPKIWEADLHLGRDVSDVARSTDLRFQPSRSLYNDIFKNMDEGEARR